MDPLSVSAGAIAFITAALQSSKLLLDLLSAIKDSPKSIQDVIRDVDQIRNILVRLSRCAPTRNDSATAALVQRCSEDVSSYTRRLSRLNISPADRWTGRILKRLSAVMSEREIEEMRTTIHHHISSLGIELSIIQM